MSGPLVLLLALAALLAIGAMAGAGDDRQGVPDPLVFSTFVGGGADDWPHAMVTAPNGTVYVAGYTASYDFPTTEGAYQRVTKGNEEVYVLHLSADGSDLLWSTLVGGSGQDIAWDLALGTDGRVYVTGITRSSDFPTTQGAYLRTREGDSDAFVLCLSPDGGDLVYSTLLGGEGDDEGYAIEALADGRVLVAGSTGSVFFPTTGGAHDRALGGLEDVFVARMSSDGRTLEASTYLGGSYSETEPSMALDGQGNVWLAGSTTSQDFPTTTGLPNSWDVGRDVFVASLAPDLGSLGGATVTGQEGTDVPRSIDVGPQGQVLVAGYSNSPEFPEETPDPGDDNRGEWDGFILVYNASLRSWDHTRLYGGGNRDVVRMAVYGPKGTVHAVGYTNSTDFPTTLGSYKPYKVGDDHDMFYMQLDPSSWYAVVNSTYIGRSMGDFGMALSFDGWGIPVIAGHTRSPDFPTAGQPFDDVHNGQGDLVVLKYTTDEDPPAFGNDLTPGQVPTGSDLTFSIDVSDATAVATVAVDYLLRTGDDETMGTEYIDGNGTYRFVLPVPDDARSVVYHFMALDVLGHMGITEARTVTVVDTVPPAMVADGSAGSGTTGDPFEFLVHVRDNWEVDGTSVEYRIGERMVNSSMDEDLRFGSGKERWNLTIHLAFDSLEPITYRYHIWDRAGNGVTTDWSTAQVLDDDPPVVGDLSVPAMARPGSTVTVSADLGDNIGVTAVTLFHYLSPSVKDAIVVEGPFGANVQVQLTLPLDQGELHLDLRVEDAAGNNATSSGVIPFRDEEPPVMRVLHGNTTGTGSTFTVHWVAEDPSGGVEMWGFYAFGAGHAFEDYTFFAAQGAPNGTFDIEIPMDSVEPLYLILASRDVFRNQNQTEPLRIQVLDDDPPWSRPLGEHDGAFFGSEWQLDASEATDNIGVDHVELIWTTPVSKERMSLNSTEPMPRLPLTEKGQYTVEVYIYDAEGNHWNQTLHFTYTDRGVDGRPPYWTEWWFWATIIVVVVVILGYAKMIAESRSDRTGPGKLE